MSEEKTERLPAEELKWQFDPDQYALPSCQDVELPEGIVGQPRAVKALEMGTELYGPGYNVFLTGFSDTGKLSTVREILEEISPKCELPKDRVYVNNFQTPTEPILLTLDRGKGVELASRMDEFIQILETELPEIIRSPEYQKQQKSIQERYREREQKKTKTFQETLEEKDLTLAEVDTGPVTEPRVMAVVNDEVMPMAEVRRLAQEEKISEEKLDTLEEHYEQKQERFKELQQETRELRNRMKQELRAVREEYVLPVIDNHLDQVKEDFENNQEVRDHLDRVRTHVLDHLEEIIHFVADTPSGEAGEDESARRKTQSTNSPFALRQMVGLHPLRIYRANVLMDNTGVEKTCEYIIEDHPTYQNLYGSIDVQSQGPGQFYADFMDIEGGSMLKADGGYLVIQAEDLLTNEDLWQIVKRTLKSEQLEIRPELMGHPMNSTYLRPEPIQLNLKVILIGSEDLYQELLEKDSDFEDIFKIKAEFDERMDRNEENLEHFLSVMAKVCKQEELLYPGREATGEILEYATREAGRQDKLSTRFEKMADLLRESNYMARKDGADEIQKDHVQSARESRKFRHNLTAEKIREKMKNGVIQISTQGRKVAQVNGLTVADRGDYSFGKPNRITASVGLGEEGIINIEREARMSGETHDKGVFILTGYLRNRFAHDKPLSLSAGICFEQLYAGVDGDSASSPEVYALLSALSDVPLRQDLAVTGSVNQHGEIQAVGGVNEKIEGFFRVCRQKGLTGNQGVIIPSDNRENLNLQTDVVEAVRDEMFHIYTVDWVREGLELLTGEEAGEADETGQYPSETIFGKADRRLRQMAEELTEFE